MTLQKHCVPCEEGTAPLSSTTIREYSSLIPAWEIASDSLSINREFTCTDFVHALSFINAIGEIAELEGHHPDIFLHDYKMVTITLRTHAIGGLSVNDFIMATKIDTIKLP